MCLFQLLSLDAVCKWGFGTKVSWCHCSMVIALCTHEVKKKRVKREKQILFWLCLALFWGCVLPGQEFSSNDSWGFQSQIPACHLFTDIHFEFEKHTKPASIHSHESCSTSKSMRSKERSKSQVSLTLLCSVCIVECTLVSESTNIIIRTMSRYWLLYNLSETQLKKDDLITICSFQYLIFWTLRERRSNISLVQQSLIINTTIHAHEAISKWIFCRLLNCLIY